MKKKQLRKYKKEAKKVMPDSLEDYEKEQVRKK